MQNQIFFPLMFSIWNTKAENTKAENQPNRIPMSHYVFNTFTCGLFMLLQALHRILGSQGSLISHLEVMSTLMQ